MKINRARKIDFLVGMPLCFLLSAIENTQKSFFYRPKPLTKISPKKIILLELSEMGSAILAYPLIEKVKEKYPSAEIYFWIFKENSEVIGLFNLIPRNNIIVMRGKNIVTLFIDSLKNILKIRKKKIDTVIDLELFSRFSSILSYLSGAMTRAGFYRYKLEGLYRGSLHTHKVMYNPYFHISRNFSFLIDALDAPSGNAPSVKIPREEGDYFLPKIKMGDRETEEVRNKIKMINSSFKDSNRIVVMNFSTDNKISVRQWPPAYYLELSEKILKKQGVFIVFTGVGLRDTLSFFPNDGRYINLIDRITVKELLGLFNISRLLISHDSGIIHLASLTDIHIISLFGPETPLLYSPLTKNKRVFYKNFSCSPCLSAYNHRNSACMDNQCMRAISVDEVFDEVTRIM